MTYIISTSSTGEQPNHNRAYMSKITYIRTIDKHGESDVDKHNNTTEIHGELLGSDIDILADNEVFDDNDNDNDGEDKFGFYNQKY